MAIESMAYHAKPSVADMRRDRSGTSIERQVAGDSARHARDRVHQKSGLSAIGGYAFLSE
jgi:hypothetical protein